MKKCLGVVKGRSAWVNEITDMPWINTSILNVFTYENNYVVILYLATHMETTLF